MGFSRRNQMLAQYKYAQASGQLVTVENPFACGYEVHRLMLYGKTELSGTPSVATPAVMTDALTPMTAGVIPSLCRGVTTDEAAQTISFVDIGILRGIPIGSTIPTAIANNAALLSGVVDVGTNGTHNYYICDTWQDSVLTRRIRKRALNGGETIYDVWSTPGMYGIGYFPNNFYDAACATIMCTHFEARTTTRLYLSRNTADYYGCCTNTGTVVNFKTTFATAAEFKSWLAAQYAAGTPVTTYTLLSTPTTENTQALSDTLTTLNGINNIWTANTLLSPEIRFQYLKRN